MSEVNIKKLSGSMIEIEHETSSEVFDSFVRDAVRELISNVEVKGFRKGHVPPSLAEKEIGEAKILERASGMAISKEWPKIIRENKLEIIGRPEFHILKIARANPFIWKVLATTMPEISLPDYLQISEEVIAKEKKDNINIDEKEVENALEWLRKSRSKEGEKEAELNDSFAYAVAGVNTLTELKENIKKGLGAEKEMKEKERIRLAILDNIASKTKMEIPEILIEAEKEKMLSELKSTIQRMGISWEKYLSDSKKTDEEILTGLRNDAEKRAAYGLILKNISRDKNISVSEEEVEERIKSMLSAYPEEEKLKIDPERMREYAYGIIANEKVFLLLENSNKK